MNFDDTDKHALNLALVEAKKAFDLGNYPVGAVLTFDNQIIGSTNNTGISQANLVNHAENKLIIENGEKILANFKLGKIISLYSTLEPCLMCLGTAVLNKIHRIVYIEKDPHAGACNIEVKSLRIRYQKTWPQIIQNHFSNESHDLLIKFFELDRERGNKKWAEMMMEIFKK